MPSVTQLPLFNDIDPKPKRCTQCGEYYPLTNEFWHKDKTKRTEYESRCKACAYKKILLYRAKNPGKRKQESIRYYKKHSDKINEDTKEWRKKNPDKKKEWILDIE